MPDVTGKKVRMVTIDSAFDGQRLDNYLLRELKGVPRSYIYKIVRKGEVRVNKGRSSVKYRLSTGDVVRIPPLRQAATEPGKLIPALAERLKSNIIYEDDGLLVLNKPSGMAVHGGSGISQGVIETLRALRPQDHNLELVHRLDRETSGCLMVARKRSTLKMLHELQRDDLVEKRYLALAVGDWGRKTHRQVDVPLRKNTLRGGERLVQVDAAGKAAQTHFELLERFDGAALVQATLVTGRTHQIRVHLAHLGHPIAGDPKYGDSSANRHFRELGLHRLFLHAASLSFVNPDNARSMQFSAPLDAELEQLLGVLRA